MKTTRTLPIAALLAGALLAPVVSAHGERQAKAEHRGAHYDVEYQRAASRHHRAYRRLTRGEPWRYADRRQVTVVLLPDRAAAVASSPAYSSTPHYASVEAGGQCREFQQAVTIGGRSEQAWGTACRQPDGSWELID